MTKDGIAWSYTYDANGMRTKRAYGSTVYRYVYNGSQLSQMTIGSNTLFFTYDASGMPMSVVYGGEQYFYATNLQGDVVALLDGSGDVVVRYTYDAWGNILSIGGDLADTLGEDNPLRYRGYVYDTETGLYYLQSRYYNPEIGRFINADAYISTGQGLLGNNMLAYCGNNPVKNKDSQGFFEECCYSEILDIDDPNDRDGFYFAYMPNPIDTGYRYGRDLSPASNSSFVSGGLYGNGYAAYGSYTDPGNTLSGGAAPRYNPNQQAVIALAKEYRKGISYKEALILVDWAEEYGIKNHGPMKHQDHSGVWSYKEHIVIAKIHIPICR